MKKKGWKLSFRGVEPILETFNETKKFSSYNKINLFQPIRQISKWWYNRKIKNHFKEIGMPINTCEGCGDGIIEWAIKNPNNKLIDMFVCQHCVGYYDIYLTKRRIELQYRINNIKRLDNDYIHRDRPGVERWHRSNR